MGFNLVGLTIWLKYTIILIRRKFIIRVSGGAGEQFASRKIRPLHAKHKVTEWTLLRHCVTFAG